MYPNLFYFFKDVFGVEWSFLRLFNTFGLFVAIAFIVASWILSLELKRKQQNGLLVHTDKKIKIGEPVNALDIFFNFLLGFVFGYKIIGAIVVPHALDNPQAFLLSSNGDLIWGLLIGALAAGYKFYEVNKAKLEKPEERTVRIWPHDRVGDVVLLAALFGFLGAKIFHNLENWNDFVKDPIGSLISFSGLTFYGGLICATIAIAIYAKKYKIPFLHLADAAAPALMIGYAIGRIGCQVAGDGDWGILNSAFITNNSGQAVSATVEQFNNTLQQNHGFYINQFGSLDAVNHLHFNSISWLPNWLVAYAYPHNVINEGIQISNCVGEYCSALPIPVFPTPFYETIVSTIFFFVLFNLRKKIKVAGFIFGVYLMLNGFERFWVEKIRVNTVYHIGNFHPTQAELISAFLFMSGLLLCWYTKRKSSLSK